MKRINSFKKYLKNGRDRYIRVNGKYRDAEKPFVVFNISIDEVKNIGNKYNQESFIYAVNKDVKQKNKNVRFEYWQKNNRPYKKLDEIDYFEFKDNDEDFFTRLKSWKFNIPFSIFENILVYNPYREILNEDVLNCVNEMIDKIHSGNLTMTYKYKLRGYINACIKTNKILENIGE